MVDGEMVRDSTWRQEVGVLVVCVWGGRGVKEEERADTHNIVEAYTPALKKDLAREAIDKGKPELEHKERDERGWEKQWRGVNLP